MSHSWDPMDYNVPGSSVHGVLQARTLEWAAVSFSRGSSRPTDWTGVSCSAGRFFTEWAMKVSLHEYRHLNTLVLFSSVTQSCPTLCDPMDCSTPGLPVHHQLLELVQTHVHQVRDAIQPSHPLPSPSPPAFNLSQTQGLFKWVSSSHQMAKILEFQLQHQSFQWIFRTDFL